MDRINQDQDAKAVKQLRLGVRAMGKQGYSADAVRSLVEDYIRQYNLEEAK